MATSWSIARGWRIHGVLCHVCAPRSGIPECPGNTTTRIQRSSSAAGTLPLVNFLTASTYRRARLFDCERFRCHFIGTPGLLPNFYPRCPHAVTRAHRRVSAFSTFLEHNKTSLHLSRLSEEISPQMPGFFAPLRMTCFPLLRRGNQSHRGLAQSEALRSGKAQGAIRQVGPCPRGMSD